MRDPLALWRDLGARGFLAFQALFLGAAAAYLGLPLLWAVWALTLAGHPPSWLGALPGWAMAGLTAIQLGGWGAMIVAALAATARRGDRWLWPWIPTLAFYWPMGAVASWLAAVELVAAPTLWRKTPHGLDRAAARRAEPPQRVGAARAGPVVGRQGPRDSGATVSGGG